jgi:SAM-dependent methyltransferase
MSNSLQAWFATPLGQYLAQQEQAHHDNIVADIFGFHALQLGLPELDLLRANRIPHKFRLARSGQADLLAEFGELPIESQSIDLLVMPHVLEFTEQPHQILREMDRVMMPEGRIVITAFNPWSMWGIRRWMRADNQQFPWNGNFISLVRMKDWLSLLGFDVSAGKLACYVPPCTREQWLQRFQFLEPAGDRWWAIAGGVYILEAIKRVQGMRIITPAWADRKLAEKEFARAGRPAGVRRQHSARSADLRIVK